MTLEERREHLDGRFDALGNDISEITKNTELLAKLYLGILYNTSEDTVDVVGLAKEPSTNDNKEVFDTIRQYITQSSPDTATASRSSL